MTIVSNKVFLYVKCLFFNVCNITTITKKYLYLLWMYVNLYLMGLPKSGMPKKSVEFRIIILLETSEILFLNFLEAVKF